MVSGRKHDGESDEGSHNVVRDSADLTSDGFDSLEYGDEDFESEGTLAESAAESMEAGGSGDKSIGATDTRYRRRACASEDRLGDRIAVDENSEGTGFRIVKPTCVNDFQVYQCMDSGVGMCKGQLQRLTVVGHVCPVRNLAFEEVHLRSEKDSGSTA